MTARELYLDQNMSLSDIAVALGRSKTSIYAELRDANVPMRQRGGPHKKRNELIRTISDERLFGTPVKQLADELGVHWTTVQEIRKERRITNGEPTEAISNG